jgi:hypothetical protein
MGFSLGIKVIPNNYDQISQELQLGCFFIAGWGTWPANILPLRLAVTVDS